MDIKLKNKIKHIINECIHTIFKNGYELKESKDLSNIGEIEYEWEYDEDDYLDWLTDVNLTDSQYSKINYIKDNVIFNLDYLDNVTFHVFNYEDCSYDQLVDYFGQKWADVIVNDCLTDGHGSIETACMFDDEEIDVNNPDELNSVAIKMLPHGDYYKDCRGFILTNGDIIYTLNEHNTCAVIPGIKGTSHFLKLGNIRVMNHAIDLMKEPTYEQRKVLRYAIAQYENDELYITMDSTEYSAAYGKYYDPDPRKVLADIDKYYSDGLHPINN